jgi:hypothetical protein
VLFSGDGKRLSSIGSGRVYRLFSGIAECFVVGAVAALDRWISLQEVGKLWNICNVFPSLV